MTAFLARRDRHRAQRRAEAGQRGLVLLMVQAHTRALPLPAIERLAGLEPSDRCEFWDGFDDKAAGIAVLHSRIVTRVLAGEMELPQ
jgi:hypothetical protein